MPPLTDNIQTALIVGGVFFLIGCATWFFASRRKAFIRTFVPADELREAGRPVDPARQDLPAGDAHHRLAADGDGDRHRPGRHGFLATRLAGER